MKTLTRSLFALAALIVAAVALSPAPANAEAADKVTLPEGYSDRVLGDPNAPVTIYEYSSLTCPHCANFHIDTLPELKEQFIDTGKAKLVYRDFPLDNLSLAGHLLTRCAPEPVYFRLMDVLFAQQATWARADKPLDSLMQYARLAGMNDEAIDACFENEQLLKNIQSVQEQAQTLYGIQSTPSFVIDGKVLAGNRPLSDFADAINGVE